ncbi:MAG: NifU family protein [Bacteroidia bacterium]|nr:NifU family protein [Bacteroidia bacterium]
MIYTEITPNPASLKFVLDRVVLRHGSADFPSPGLAEESPLARKLFEYKFVERVFLGYNFITVTKSADFQWEEVIPAVKTFLKAWLASDQPIVTGSLAEAPAEEAGSEDDELTRRIKELLETHVRPAVAMDGGDIIYEDFREGTLWLKLQGSCSGCPSSTITLKRGIEGLVTRMVPEVKRVEAV